MVGGGRAMGLGLGCGCAALSVFCGTATGETLTASGTVYHDRNGNGVMDRGEPGIGGVLVSNGEDVVATGPGGAYSILVDADDDVLFVIKPRGWMTPLDDQNKPVFHYVHRPTGTVNDGFIFDGIGPTGPLPASIDFALRPQTEPESFEVLFLGDPQPYNERQLGYYGREIVSELVADRGRGHDAAFAVALGDLVGDDLDLFEPYNDLNAMLGVPVYNVHGNHDLNFMAENDADSDDTFQRVFGPATYAFQYGPVTFVILDNVEYFGFDGFREDGFPRTGHYTGRLRDDQLAFVRNVVETVPSDELIVVSMHIPLFDPSTEKHSTPEHRELMGILSGHSNTLSFSAHTHRLWREFLGPAQNYSARGSGYHLHVNAGATSGSWWRGPLGEDGVPFSVMTDGTPNGYIVAAFDGNGYRLRWKVAGEAASRQMHFNVPDVVAASVFESFEVIANVYMGDRDSVVEMRVLDRGGGAAIDWTRAPHRAAEDPVYAALYERDREMSLSPEGSEVRPPQVSSHLFGLSFGASLPAGVYTLEARYTDRWGREHHGRRVFRVAE